MAKKGFSRPLPASNSGAKPGDFPLGSLESRAAARAMLGTVTAKDCICFPLEEPPDLELKPEIESARAVRCPLHGERFSRLAPTIYRVILVPAHLNRPCWDWHSPQYIKAMEASFPSDRFPASRVEDPDGAVRFVLKDGTEIHRLRPPDLVYDLDTGEPCGRLDWYGRFLPLLPPVTHPEDLPVRTKLR